MRRWAALGAAVLLAELAILADWVTGPYFHHVSSGPDAVPGRMKAGLIAWQVILPLAGLAAIRLVQLAMFLGYTFPNSIVGLHSTQWNQDTQQRSYLTYTCGPEAGRPCPPSAVRP